MSHNFTKRNLRCKLLFKVSTSAAGAMAALFLSQPALADPTPSNVVSACSGVSLPRSVVTDIISPVVTGVSGATENRVNQILGIVGTIPIVGQVLPPLNTNATGLLANAASGAPINLQVLSRNGTIIGPSDQCYSGADGFTLNTQGGIAIGGNVISGLGVDGSPAIAGEDDAIAFGNGARTGVGANGAIAFGSNTNVALLADGSIAVGQGALVSVSKSVAIGQNSAALRGALSNYTALGLAGLQNSAGEFSVGAVGSARQITNVAAGSLPTDAVNVAQLQGVADGLDALDDIAIKYNDVTRTVATLGGVGGTTLTNVRAGAVNGSSTDAVNGSQLFATNEQVGTNTTNIANLTTQVTTNTGDILTLQNTVSNHTTQIGQINSNITNVISTVDSHTTLINQNAADISNLTSIVGGHTTLITQNETDITNLQTRITNGAIGTVQYSNAVDPTLPNGGTPSQHLTLVGATSDPVQLHNVGEGAIAIGSTDAVNGGQLKGVSDTIGVAVVTSLGGGSAYNNTTGAITGPTYVIGGSNYNNVGDALAAVASASGSAVDPNAVRFTDSSHTAISLASGGTAITNVAAGAVNAASSDAVNGSQLYATDQRAAQALAVANNSVQYDDSTQANVTFGPPAAPPVALHNIATGVRGTDAVNVSQLNALVNSGLTQANNYTDLKINGLAFDLKGFANDASAGTAGALAVAGLPQAYEEGKGLVAIGAGTYNGESAVAFGFSKAFDDGRTVIKLGGTYNSQGKVAGSAGIGFQID